MSVTIKSNVSIKGKATIGSAATPAGPTNYLAQADWTKTRVENSWDGDVFVLASGAGGMTLVANDPSMLSAQSAIEPYFYIVYSATASGGGNDFDEAQLHPRNASDQEASTNSGNQTTGDPNGYNIIFRSTLNNTTDIAKVFVNQNSNSFEMRFEGFYFEDPSSLYPGYNLVS